MKWRTAERCRHVVLIIHRHRDRDDGHPQKRIHFVTGFRLFALQLTVPAYRYWLIPQNGLLRLSIISSKLPSLLWTCEWWNSSRCLLVMKGVDLVSSLLYSRGVITRVSVCEASQSSMRLSRSYMSSNGQIYEFNLLYEAIFNMWRHFLQLL